MTNMTYNELVRCVETTGIRTAPRGLKTTEMIGLSIQFSPVTMIERVGMNRDLMFLEAMMWLAGIFDINLIKKIAPKANHELFEHQSDYGPRSHWQLLNAYRLLSDDLYTRKAVVNLNTRDELKTDGIDMACTNALQFLYRGDRLYTIVSMRSWDLAYGFPMDIFMYGVIARWMAMALHVEFGPIIANVGSLHLYDSTKHLARGEAKQIWNFGLEAYDGSTIISLPKLAANALSDFASGKNPNAVSNFFGYRPLSFTDEFLFNVSGGI